MCSAHHKAYGLASSSCQRACVYLRTPPPLTRCATPWRSCSLKSSLRPATTFRPLSIHDSSTAYKAENFSSDIRGLSSNISAIYQDTLSTLSYRIKVTGSAQHLNNPQVADLVRAVLMCGIRAAFLWRQLGGSRLKLMWQRGAIRDTAAGMARELGVTH